MNKEIKCSTCGNKFKKYKDKTDCIYCRSEYTKKVINKWRR